ncbi:MAG TPA: transglutaminase domain-containing protein [Anaerolineae bacterium]|nr:transglutaminase domain-containing protein [Anaerolineae bacterium]
MTRVIEWGWYRFRPAEGWLSLALLAAAVALAGGAVLAVGWTAEDGVVIPALVWGLGLGALLAKRPLPTLPAWLLISLYALLITTLHLARLWPPLPVLLDGWEPTRQFWLQNGALFADRMASWFAAVLGGGSSQETIVFAFGLGLLSFLLAAFAGWSTFRRQRPFLGLIVLGLALALNSYFGVVEIWWLAGFIGVAALTTAVIHYANLERGWDSRGVDYSGEVRIELIMHAGVIAAFLIALSLLLPAFSITKLQEAFVQWTAVQQTDETLGRAFAGVAQPRQNRPEANPGGVGGSGLLPRNYLLGLPPDLAETVMMTATVSVAGADGQPEIAPSSLVRGTHWRALSYDVYTGRGWAISEERRETIPPNAPIPLPPADGQTALWQEINWVKDRRIIRYSVGLPQQFEEEVTVSWRGLSDLARVWGTQTRYRALSSLTTAGANELRGTAVADIPPAILARYTQLPDAVTQRTRDLAGEVAGQYDNPYDQARALEQFLRQYPYTLDVELPPEGRDPVDFFLFDLQKGYCDYYASAMVVMARSLGLPARLGVGFLAQPPDENGVQTIRQINGHSWAEIYFAGYGWVEFEPTAAFPSPRDETAVAATPAGVDPAEEPYAEVAVPNIPERSRPFPWQRLVIVGGILGLITFIWRRQRQKRQGWDEVQWRYGRLQASAAKIGQPVPASQTPDEFTAALLARLDWWGERPYLTRLIAPMRPHVIRLSAAFGRRQYAPDHPLDTAVARESWGRLRRPFWVLRVLRKIVG